MYIHVAYMYENIKKKICYTNVYFFLMHKIVW